MKKKLIGLLAAVMAVSMTTSAFAASAEEAANPRTAFNVDGSRVFSANDVYRVFKADPEKDVNGDRKFNSADADVLYSLALQPKNVEAKAFVFADATGTVEVHTQDTGIVPMAHLGYGVKTDEYGTDVLVKLDNGATLKEISDDVFNYVKATDTRAKQVSTQLNKIFFNSATKGDVYLRTDDGWSMLCYALRYVVPMKESDAMTCNKVAQLKAENYTFATGNEENVKALDAIKAVVVGTNDFTTTDIQTIQDNIYTAFPSGIAADVIEKTAVEVLKITDRKYTVTVEYNGVPQTLSAATVANSQFIKDVEKLADYDKVTVQEAIDIFGTQVTVTAGKNVATVGIGFGLNLKAAQ